MNVTAERNVSKFISRYTFGPLLSFVCAAFKLFFLNVVIELKRAPLPLVGGAAPLVVGAGVGGAIGGGAGTWGAFDPPELSTDWAFPKNIYLTVL
jgi:hypothetical protein